MRKIAEAWNGSPATPEIQLRIEELRGGIGRAMLAEYRLRVSRPMLPRAGVMGLREGTSLWFAHIAPPDTPGRF